MKKLLLILGGSLLLLVVAGVIVAQFFLGSIITKGVNEFAPRVTKAPVTLAGAKVSPFTGSGELTDLLVGNPAGWTSAKAFSVARIDVSVQPSSLLGDQVVINHLIIEAPEFVYETRLVASNVGDLLKNIESFMGPSAAPSDSAGGESVKIIVKKLSVRNGKVTAAVAGAGLTLPMPPIELTDLGTNEGGLTPVQLAAAIMRSMTTSVVAAVKDKAIPALGAGLNSGGDAAEAARDAAKKAGGAILDIFGGKK